ncbi:hypothetical protein [Streptomyces nigrescens]|uniref:hypothetical protein n=1 Tax=Streptomyces nigrescens TaxID=1920 RepID=UPI00348361DB
MSMRIWPGSRVHHRARAPLLAVGAALVATCALTLPTAHAEQAAPVAKAAPAAFQEVWRTDFDGVAGSQPAADDWITDTGTGYPSGPPNWGTGERQTYTDRPENLQLDGAGHLRITARKDGASWTSGRIESRRSDFAAPSGGTLRIEADTWARATHHGHFLLLNLAMGGAFPDGAAGFATPTDATRPGGSLLVDHVAVSVRQPAGARTDRAATPTDRHPAPQGATS